MSTKFKGVYYHSAIPLTDRTIQRSISFEEVQYLDKPFWEKATFEEWWSHILSWNERYGSGEREWWSGWIIDFLRAGDAEKPKHFQSGVVKGHFFSDDSWRVKQNSGSFAYFFTDSVLLFGIFSMKINFLMLELIKSVYCENSIKGLVQHAPRFQGKLGVLALIELEFTFGN